MLAFYVAAQAYKIVDGETDQHIMTHHEAGPGTGRPDNREVKAYPFKLDAVVLAGTHQNTKRLIAGRNKAFLKVGEQVLIRYVVDALMGAEHIDQIFVVGPVEELLGVLAGFPARVRVIAQRGKMLTNCWAGIEADAGEFKTTQGMYVKDRPCLL